MKKKAGGAEGIRTPDPHNAIVVLYQLSYDPSQMERQFRCGSGKVKRFGHATGRALFAKRVLGRFGNHAALAGEVEEAAGIDDGLDIAEGF